ncbi:unnamed protein product [Caenorhabditis auriculariae]|uniref:C2 domain-containing protein n=1 Tax=Caenorhabditis auriculariae TaxID=2777116 RepID=A0A8S1GQ65_9PELO|nr:unnamed protein product [Caenorhabditis auriculariae]
MTLAMDRKDPMISSRRLATVDPWQERFQLQSQLDQVRLELDSVRTTLDENSLGQTDRKNVWLVVTAILIVGAVSSPPLFSALSSAIPIRNIRMQQQHMSTYPSLLEPAICRRRLPVPPDPMMSRRSSSPRILPTPPPLSPEYRSPSTMPNLERRPSGRVLPRPPLASDILTKSKSVSPVSLTPDPTPDPEFNVIIDRLIAEDIDEVDDIVEEPEASSNADSYDDDAYDDVKPLTTSTAINGHLTSPMTNDVIYNGKERRLSASQFSSHSASIEQLTSKSSSEDPLAHGLDPSMYSPQPISTSGQRSSFSERGVTPEKEVITASTSANNINRQPSGLGLLHVSLQHFPVRKRLRVSLLKIEALAGELKPEMEIHAICRVSIPWLKGGKEQVSEMKRGRDPVFNQEFFFDNVTHEELDTKHVLVSAYHQGGAKLAKDILIGDATFPLRQIRELNTKKEIRMLEEIQPQVPKKLGKIYTSTCIEKEAKRLTINLKKVDDLPRCGLTGAPDVCVRVTLTQGGTTKTKSSRILKSTTTAVYNEAVMFLFSPNKNDLAATSITISVHDMQRSCTGNDTIGCAYLGVNAVDKSEMEQWKNAVEHMGKEYKGSHHLKPLVTTPAVSVAEANETGAENDNEDDS